MKILESIDEIKEIRRNLNGPVGFVPTMGYLHQGHQSLIEAAKKACSHVFVSIFVNPIQFAPEEDLARYPRDIERDKKILQDLEVDYLFFPNEASMYPQGYQTYIDVTDLSKGLCGSSRPDHFRGVATVVLKLFNIVRPDFAYFGQKDAQQCAVIRRMVQDLNLDVMVRVCPIVRDRDGLALSSRNRYLSARERKLALFLPETLQNIAQGIIQGKIRRREEALHSFQLRFRDIPEITVDYVDLVDFNTLTPPESTIGGNDDWLLAAAVWVGRTRLIDNIVHLGDSSSEGCDSTPSGGSEDFKATGMVKENEEF